MESAWNYYYSITKRMLSFTGQWPYQGRRAKIFGVSLLTVTIFSMIVPQVGKIIQCGEDVQCILLVVPSCLLMALMMVKLYTCQFNSNKIKNLIDHVRSDWEKLESAEEHEIMETYAAKARLYSLIYCLYYHITIGIFVSSSLVPHILNIMLPLNESHSIFMPYESYYFVDGDKYFFYIYFHAIVAVEIAITAVLAHDCMFLTYIEHVCSVFAVAGFCFGTLARNENNNRANNSLDNEYDRKIAVSVHAHLRAIQFAELLEDTFRVTFAVQIIIVTLAMSVSLLQIVVRLDEVVDAMRYMAFVVSQLIHLFCFSLQGQKLIDHSVQLRDEIYNSSWYEMPVKYQRMLLYVMRRCLQPNFLSAGKIYIFSLKSFTTIVQMSVSYFTVLASFQ